MSTVSVPFDEVSAANEKGDVVPPPGARRDRVAARPRTEQPRSRVFHASSTAPVPSRTGGAVGEGWETQLRIPIERVSMATENCTCPATEKRTLSGTSSGRYRRHPGDRYGVGAMCGIERGDVPDRGGAGRTCVRSVPVLLPDDPAPRFPPPAHRRCICLGDRARGQPVENAPCQVRHRAVRPSRGHSGSAVRSTPAPPPARFPRFVHGTGPQINRSPGWSKRGQRYSASIEWGDVLSGYRPPRIDRHPA